MPYLAVQGSDRPKTTLQIHQVTLMSHGSGEKSDKKGGENELLLTFTMYWADLPPRFQAVFQIILLNIILGHFFK